MKKFMNKQQLMLLVLICVYLLDVAFWGVHGRELIDSDMSSEILLAKILNDEHSILGMTTSWYYSSELRLLHMQWFYRLGLLISPNNWHMARVISMALGLALLVFLTYKLFVVLELKEIALLAATVVLFPAGSWYCWQTIFGGQYLPYIFISLGSLICIVQITKNTGKKKKVCLTAVLILLAFCAGINGVKQLMVFYAPLMLATGLMFFIESRKNKKFSLKSQTSYALIMSAVATVSSFAGYIVNSKLLSRVFVFDQYNDTRITGGSVQKLLRDFIWSFGYADNKKLFSFRGIAAIIGLMIGSAVLVCGWRLLKRYYELDYLEQFITTFSIVSIVFCILVFSYVQGAIQYFQPVIPFGLFLIALEINTEAFCFKHSKFSAEMALIVLLFIVSVGTLENEYDGPLHSYAARKNMSQVADAMQQLGYEQGVADYWDANIVTELSNGKIDMWAVTYFGSDEMFQWLQKTEHFSKWPEGKYFFLFRDNYNIYDFLERHPELEEVYAEDGYIVYGN